MRNIYEQRIYNHNKGGKENFIILEKFCDHESK